MDHQPISSRPAKKEKTKYNNKKDTGQTERKHKIHIFERGGGKTQEKKRKEKTHIFFLKK